MLDRKNIVTPWNLDDFNGTDAQKAFILRKLSDRKFEVKKYTNSPIDEKLINFVKKLLNELNDNDWVLLISNQPEFVKRATDVLPIVFALTYKKSVGSVTNNLLERLYQGYIDDEFSNPSEYIQELNKTCLIVHKNINDANAKLKQFKGQTSEFMEHRSKTGKKYLMTAITRDNTVNNTIFAEIEDIFGRTVATWIDNQAERLVFNSETKPKNWRRIKIE